VSLDGSDAHKIVNVLRMREGDAIEVTDSAAQRFAASLIIDARGIRATLLERKPSSERQALQITVAQGVPKGQKMDFVVEKLTELGVSRITPLRSERTIVTDVGVQKLERWRRLAKTAAQQCGRDRMLQVDEPQSLEALCARFSDYDAVLLPWELAEQMPLRETLPLLVQGAQSVLVVIGPEGGFSHAEAERSVRAGGHALWLGPRILRTETAAMVLVSILNYLAG